MKIYSHVLYNYVLLDTITMCLATEDITEAPVHFQAKHQEDLHQNVPLVSVFPGLLRTSFTSVEF